MANDYRLYFGSVIEDRLDFLNNYLNNYIKDLKTNAKDIIFDKTFNDFISKDLTASMYYALVVIYDFFDESIKFVRMQNLDSCINTSNQNNIIMTDLNYSLKFCLAKYFDFFDNNLKLNAYSNIEVDIGRYMTLNQAMLANHVNKNLELYMAKKTKSNQIQFGKELAIGNNNTNYVIDVLQEQNKYKLLPYIISMNKNQKFKILKKIDGCLNKLNTENKTYSFKDAYQICVKSLIESVLF